MKTKFTRIYSLLAILIAAVLINACRIKDPLEGFVVSVKTDAISAAHVFRLVDNKTGATVNAFENATVTLSGPGAANLYDADGRKNFRIVEGRIGICIRRGVNPSGATPVNFTLNVTVPGYLPKSLSYSLKSIMPTTNTITLVNENDLPSGASKKDTTISVPATGITQPIVFTTATTATKTEQAKITLPAGTRFLDANGNAVSGNITATIIHTQFQDSTNSAMKTVGAFDNNFKDENGNDIKLSVVEGEAIDISFKATGKNAQDVTPSDPIQIEFFDNLVPYILEITQDAEGNIIKTVRPKTAGVTTRARKIASLPATRPVTTTRFSIKDYSNPAVKSMAGNGMRLVAFSWTNPISVIFSSITPEIDGTFDANITRFAPQPDAPFGGGLISDLFVSTPFAKTAWAGKNLIEYDFVEQQSLLKVYFGVDCQSGQVKRPVLPEGTQIYLIDEAKYQASAANTTHGNKIFPEDAALRDGTVWKKYTVNGLETKDNKVYSIVYIPWKDLTPGAEYRASYYRAGKRQDNNVNDPNGKIFAPSDNTIREMPPIDMIVPDCN